MKTTTIHTIHAHRVDRAARVAGALAAIQRFTYRHNPRTMVENTEVLYTWYLHEAMGYRADQPEY